MNLTFCFLKQVGHLRPMLLATSLWLIAFGAAHAAGEVVLVTAVQGNVTVQGETGGQMKLEPFVRLRSGDRLALTAGSQASLLFAAAGRMEIWKGAVVWTLRKARARPLLWASRNCRYARFLLKWHDR